MHNVRLKKRKKRNFAPNTPKIPYATPEQEAERIEKLKKIIDFCGGQVAVSQILGITQGAVSLWHRPYVLGPSINNAKTLVAWCRDNLTLVDDEGRKVRVRLEDLRPDLARTPDGAKNKEDLAASVI